MGETFASLMVLTILLLPLAGRAQEEKESPSQKTKGAVEKLLKAPESVRKSLEALKEAAKGKLEEALQGTTGSKGETDSLTVPPKKAETPEAPRYSSVGKRDPFQPLSLKRKATPRPLEKLTPLERYELGQLKLVGIIWDVKEPRAMVEDATGVGFIITVGTPIGANEGKVKAIKPTEIVVQESYIDFYGAKKSREVTMKLPGE